MNPTVDIIQGLADDRQFRVNLMCSCNQDVTYGYGATEEEARKIAEQEFRAHGTRATYSHVVVERVSVDGTHYQTQRVAMHVEMPAGLGSELKLRATVLAWGAALLDGAIVVKNPKADTKRRVYVFESSDEGQIRALLSLLHKTRTNPPSGQGGRSIGQAARQKLVDLKPLVKLQWPELWEERLV